MELVLMYMLTMRLFSLVLDFDVADGSPNSYRNRTYSSAESGPRASKFSEVRQILRWIGLCHGNSLVNPRTCVVRNLGWSANCRLSWRKEGMEDRCQRYVCVSRLCLGR